MNSIKRNSLVMVAVLAMIPGLKAQGPNQNGNGSTVKLVGTETLSHNQSNGKSDTMHVTQRTRRNYGSEGDGAESQSPLAQLLKKFGFSFGPAGR